MSPISMHSASRTLSASPASVRAALEQIQQIPRWNPAITSVAPPASGKPGVFAIRSLGWIPGRLIADTTHDVISMSISIPGLKERSSWQLTPSPSGTTVRHEIHQQGPLTALIGAPEAARVPAKRLSRLDAYLKSGTLMS